MHESKKHMVANEYKSWKRRDSYTEYDSNAFSTESCDNKRATHAQYVSGAPMCRYAPSNEYYENSRTTEMTYAASVTMKCASNEMIPSYFQNYPKTFLETT